MKDIKEMEKKIRERIDFYGLNQILKDDEDSFVYDILEIIN